MNKLFIISVLCFILIGLIFGTATVLAEKGGNGGSDKGNSGNSGSSGNSENSNSGKSDNKVSLSPNDDSDDEEDKDNDDSEDDDESELSSDSSGKSEGNSGKSDKDEFKLIEKKKIVDENGNVREVKIKIEEETEEGKKIRKIKVEREDEDNEGQEVEVKTELDIKEERENDKIKIKAKLSNGSFVDIKVMPDKAADIAIEILKSLNFSIELKEINITKGKIKVVYEVESDKEGRLLGIIKAKVNYKAVIDPETGEVIKVKKSWWAFLVAGDADFPAQDKVTICHLPPGNPENAQTITIGGPAVKAHLKHGDLIGPCAGDEEGNETGNETQGNETLSNLTLEILSPQNITYNMTDILIELSSNGDYISYKINNGTEEIYNGSITKTFLEGENMLSAFANNTNSSLTKEVVFSVVLPTNITLPGNETGTGNESNSSV